MAFEEIIKDIEFVEDNIDDIIMDVVMGFEEEIVSMNVDDQLYDRGIDSNGDEIFLRDPYTLFTREHKRATNQPFDRVTLKETGAFHRGFFVKRGDDWFELDSRERKRDKLVRRYGDVVFGLVDDNVERLGRIMEDNFINQVGKIILT
jgi:hypothetical protein